MSDDFDDLSTVRRPKLDVSPAPEGAFVIEVEEGPDRGKKIRIDPSQSTGILIGQGPACPIRLSDPAVSRRHAALDHGGRRLRIRDLESTNGTVVDGVAIVEAYLSGGELVRLGSTALRVVHQSGSAVTPPPSTSFGGVIGASTEMRRLYPLFEKLAASNLSVLIEGETGTGKEALAESIHQKSGRAEGPFVVFDCTAVPPSLVESELFGHERGAFTGAVKTRQGVFEQASGGTLLIDEIGDLDLSLQPKLLRAIERSEIRRVGGDKAIKVDVRILAATRRDLDREIQAGRFRDDLFHRLAVARVELPPLRRRRGDIRVLSQHFARTLGAAPGALSDEILERWEDYPWPGNVRELRNAVARQLTLGDLGGLVSAAPREPTAPADPIDAILALDLPLAEARRRLLESFEQRYIERVLEKSGGHVGKAAEASGVARRYFQLLRAKSTRSE